MGVALGFAFFFIFCFFFGMAGAAAIYQIFRPMASVLMNRIRKADVKTVYGWIDRVSKERPDRVRVVANVPHVFFTRRVEITFHNLRVLPSTAFMEGQCIPKPMKRIPSNLAGAIRLHMFPEPFEFPEEE